LREKRREALVRDIEARTIRGIPGRGAVLREPWTSQLDRFFRTVLRFAKNTVQLFRLCLLEEPVIDVDATECSTGGHFDCLQRVFSAGGCAGGGPRPANTYLRVGTVELGELGLLRSHEEPVAACGQFHPEGAFTAA
jgi:hypothetical protein